MRTQEAAKKLSTDFSKQLLKASEACSEIKQEKKVTKVNTQDFTADKIRKRVVKEDALNPMFRLK